MNVIRAVAVRQVQASGSSRTGTPRPGRRRCTCRAARRPGCRRCRTSRGRRRRRCTARPSRRIRRRTTCRTRRSAARAVAAPPPRWPRRSSCGRSGPGSTSRSGYFSQSRSRSSTFSGSAMASRLARCIMMIRPRRSATSIRCSGMNSVMPAVHGVAGRRVEAVRLEAEKAVALDARLDLARPSCRDARASGPPSAGRCASSLREKRVRRRRSRTGAGTGTGTPADGPRGPASAARPRRRPAPRSRRRRSFPRMAAIAPCRPCPGRG